MSLPRHLSTCEPEDNSQSLLISVIQTEICLFKSEIILNQITYSISKQANSWLSRINETKHSGESQEKQEKQYSVWSRYTLIARLARENKNWNIKTFLPAYCKLKASNTSLPIQNGNKPKFYRHYNLILVSSIKHHLKVDTIRSHFNLSGLKFISMFHSGEVNILWTQHMVRLEYIFITDTSSCSANEFVLFCSWKMWFFL